MRFGAFFVGPCDEGERLLKPVQCGVAFIMKVFEPFRLDTANHCLWRSEERMSLTPKAFDLLRYLVEHAERLVTQDEILEALWPETYVNPEGIRKYILEIRKVLGDQRNPPLFIETFPKRGYQFVAKVTDERALPPSGVEIELGNIVGRDASLAELNQALEKTSMGKRQVIFVTGEAGVGKTTLVDVFQQNAVQRTDLRIVRGQCIEGFGAEEAYYPMLEAMGSLVRNGQDDSLVQSLAKHAPTWLAQFPYLVKAEEKDSLQREILGTTRGRMVREICEALEAMTAEKPLIVILEDLHWVDPSTLDLISAFARRREPAKVLLIGTYRPVDVVLSQSPLKALKQDLQLRQLSHEIAVERLEEPDIAEYLQREFANNSFPAGLAKVIHHNSGGNALFMAAMVRDIVKKGLIAHDGRGWILTAPLEKLYPGIPETLQQMLEIQFQQLSAEEQRILQSASVAGERFSVWAAAAILDAAPASIEEECDKLATRHQFIRWVGIHNAPNAAPSAHYEFRHSLYRQALHRRLSNIERSKQHRSLGERLMAICFSGRRELAAEVALHLEEGRDYDQAARCWTLAAENAARLFAYRDSIRALQHRAPTGSTACGQRTNRIGNCTFFRASAMPITHWAPCRKPPPLTKPRPCERRKVVSECTNRSLEPAGLSDLGSGSRSWQRHLRSGYRSGQSVRRSAASGTDAVSGGLFPITLSGLGKRKRRTPANPHARPSIFSAPHVA